MPKLVTKQRESRINAYLAAVTPSASDNPVNPLKDLRAQSGLTMQGICDLSGISRQALIRAEQGVYPSIPERLLTFWLDFRFVNREPVTYVELTTSYTNFKLATRASHYRMFGTPEFLVTPSAVGNLTTHPLQLLFDNWELPDLTKLGKMNPTEFAKLLCISQSVVDHFLKKIANQASVPTQIRSALFDSGYTNNELANFEKCYVRYREFTLNQRVLDFNTEVVNPNVKRTAGGKLKVASPKLDLPKKPNFMDELKAALSDG